MLRGHDPGYPAARQCDGSGRTGIFSVVISLRVTPYESTTSQLGVIVMPLALSAALNSYGPLTEDGAIRMAFATVAGQTIAILSVIAARTNDHPSAETGGSCTLCDHRRSSHAHRDRNDDERG